jgi:hypothetical protein
MIQIDAFDPYFWIAVPSPIRDALVVLEIDHCGSAIVEIGTMTRGALGTSRDYRDDSLVMRNARRCILHNKTRALITHDRILRGQSSNPPANPAKETL